MARRAAKRQQTDGRDLRSMLRAEAPTILGIVSLAAVTLFHGPLFADLHNYPLTALLFLWLFAAMLWCAFGVVRHAEVVAERLGEPYGTLLLTLAVIAIEVALLASVSCMATTTRRWRATPCSRR